MHIPLTGLLTTLVARCVYLKDLLKALPRDPITDTYVRQAYKEIELSRREAATMLADPDLGDPNFLKPFMRRYRRLYEDLSLVEYYIVPFVQRFNDDDRHLTSIIASMSAEAKWPDPAPLVGAFSAEYYWTFVRFGVVCVPAAESSSLLGLPDGAHEMGHILWFSHSPLLIGHFLQELQSYIRGEQARAKSQQLATDYQRLLDDLFALWGDAWLIEFAADMIATYMVGAPYGFQNVRLCASQGSPIYKPALGETDGHPADEARNRAILAVLQELGASDEVRAVSDLWDTYVSVDGAVRPADYNVCYPQHLIELLASSIVAGCRTLGINSFKDYGNAPSDNLVVLINEAWTRFLSDPKNYADWEDKQIGMLKRKSGRTK